MASAPKSFGSQLQLNKIPVLNLVPESGATAPTSPVAGQLWLDTSVSPSRLKVYENGGWVLSSQTGTEQTANKGIANGYASLNASVQVPLVQLPVASSGTNTSTALVRADDSRLADPRPTTDGSVTGGTAGTGVKIAANTITDANVAATNKDGAVGVPSLRTLGYTGLAAMPGIARLDQIAVPTATVNLNSQVLTGLGTPVGLTDAVNKNYADTLRQGLRLKDAVVVATTGPITLSGPQSIDTIGVTAGQRVLVKDQGTASQNGIYLVAAGAWTRDTDADTFQELQDGSTTFVQQGATLANTSWAQINTLTSLSDVQTWVQQGSAVSYLAGNGLALNGTTFSALGTASRVTVTGAGIDIASNYSGQNTITTLGTVGTGTWNGTTIALANGGTGATTAAGARTALGAVGKYAGAVGALVAGTETLITHNLGVQDVIAKFYDATTLYEIEMSWRMIPANTNQIGVTADLAAGYAANAVRVVVIG